MDYRSARCVCTALSGLSLGTVETLRMMDYFLFGPLATLFVYPFFPETSLFTPVFARVLKFVLMGFFLNLLKKSI